MHVVDDVILAAWICFWAYWLVCSFNVKTARTRSSGGIAIRVALVLVVLSLVRGRVIKGHAATVSNPVLQGIGLAVFFSGLALAVWARLYLGRNWGNTDVAEGRSRVGHDRPVSIRSPSHLLRDHPRDGRDDDRSQLVLAGGGRVPVN
jgi:hypothetical protein